MACFARNRTRYKVRIRRYRRQGRYENALIKYKKDHPSSAHTSSVKDIVKDTMWITDELLR